MDTLCWAFEAKKIIQLHSIVLFNTGVIFLGESVWVLPAFAREGSILILRRTREDTRKETFREIAERERDS